MSAPRHEDAILLLRLYELGETPAQEKAWQFVFSNEFIDDYEAFTKKYPPSSDHYQQVFTYAAWFELCGTLWKHKLLNGTLFFDWILVPPRWRRIEKFMQGYRQSTGEPRMFENFEALAKAAN